MTDTNTRTVSLTFGERLLLLTNMWGLLRGNAKAGRRLRRITDALGFHFVDRRLGPVTPELNFQWRKVTKTDGAEIFVPDWDAPNDAPCLFRVAALDYTFVADEIGDLEVQLTPDWMHVLDVFQVQTFLEPVTPDAPDTP